MTIFSYANHAFHTHAVQALLRSILLLTKMSQSQSTQVKIASNKKAKSKLWKHFGFLVEGSGETETVNKKKVVCRLCNNVSPYAGCTTNLAAHLERHHTAEYQVYLTETKSGQSQSTTITTAQSSH